MFSVNHIFLVYKSDSGGKGCPGSLCQTQALVLGFQTLLSIPVLGVGFCGIAQQWQLACAARTFSLFLIWVVINQGKFWSQHLNPFKSILIHLKSISQTVSLHKWLKSKGNTYIKDWHTLPKGLIPWGFLKKMLFLTADGAKRTGNIYPGWHTQFNHFQQRFLSLWTPDNAHTSILLFSVALVPHYANSLTSASERTVNNCR